ncbi:F-box only protein 33 [Amblyomma americanum]|uniref:F-box domain-containing protein n=1 Tax=Amblyomma americanum TaxID=6943 RepID=A0AAQ4DJD3_AMBAM
MSVGWARGDFAALPSVVLVEIYEYLSFRDKLKASSTCRAWRECLFHPRFWTTLTIRLSRKRNAWRQAEFLSRKCGRFVRHFTLEFDCTSPQIVQQCVAVLAFLGENRQLASLCLRPTACVVAWPLRPSDGPTCTGNENETIAVYDRFIEAIRQVICTTNHLEHFSLGCLEDIFHHSDSFLTLLSLHQRRSLSQLYLASVKEDPDHYPIPEVHLRHLHQFECLTALSIDYDYVCDQFLLLLSERGVLSKLVLHVHGLDDQQTVCEGSWIELGRRCPKLRVTVTLLHTCEPWSAIKSLLCAAIPLARFQSYFSDGFRSDVLDLLSAQYADTVEAVVVVSSLSGSEGIPQRTFAVRAESPVVMLAWRCHRLSSLKLVGHEIADMDLIAVARLRGPQLKELVIPADCVSGSSGGGPYYSELRPTDVKHLETEVSLSLQRTWALATLQSPVQDEVGDVRSYMRSLQELQGYART